MFKIGQIIKAPRGTAPSAAKTDKFEVYWVEGDGTRAFIGKKEDPLFFGGSEPKDPEAAKKYNWVVKLGEVEIISEPSNIKNIMTNLTKKFRLLTKSEPEKTFIEQGVMDDNENLTTEGRALFEAFLITKFGPEFKTEVVDKLVEEKK